MVHSASPVCQRTPVFVERKRGFFDRLQKPHLPIGRCGFFEDHLDTKNMIVNSRPMIQVPSLISFTLPVNRWIMM